MTHEDVARRIITVRNLRSPYRAGGRPADSLSQRDETRTVPRKTREIARLERTSQDAYDRASRGVGSRDCWRPWPRLFDAAIDAILLGHVDASIDELRDAFDVVTAAEQAATQGAKYRLLEEHGAAIARLVWNQAEDHAFLDRALVDELTGTEALGVALITADSNFLVRVALTKIARELRLQFPGRQRLSAT